tara:strand:+ start:6862 stop:7632 length:771 start_codon:yes stop_codon:yes gene_type:complete
MNNEHDPHAENKRLYAIDVALVGEDEAPKRWQYRFKGDDNYRGAWITPMGSMFTGGGEYRRDPNAPPQPSLDWLDAPDWAKFLKFDKTPSFGKWAERETPNYIVDYQEPRPPQAWFDLMRAERESAEPDSEGWIAWHGNEGDVCPLPDGTPHEVRFDDGQTIKDDMPETWNWGESQEPIIAYRVIEPASEPADDGVLSGADEMLATDNRRLRTAGCNLAEAASRVIDTYDGVHRLSIAVAGWYSAVANEGCRGGQS